MEHSNSIRAANVLKDAGQRRASAVAHIFDGPQAATHLATDEANINFPAVAELIRQHLTEDALEQAADAAADFEPSSSSRIGPRTVRLDEASAAGDIRIDDLTVESLSNFSSARATTAIFKGKWMYEVILGTCGIQQIGWATLQCPFTSEEGVGDAPDSYAWDGKRVQRWNVSPHPYGTPWAPGDVIGVCADMENGQLSFVKNGTHMGVAFSNIRNFQPGTAFFPALSISHGERSELNFGSQPFRYPVDGFQPIQDPPSGAQQEAAQYLLTAFRRLVRLSASSGLEAHLFAPSAASATIGDVDILVDGPQAYSAMETGAGGTGQGRLLSTDDAVLLASALARHLGPLMEDPYLVSRYVLPTFQELLGEHGPQHNEALLGWAVQLLGLVLEPYEGQAMYSQLFCVLARAARTEQLSPAQSAYAGPYSSVALAAALLRAPASRQHMLADPAVMERLEALLTRKLVTGRELRTLLPTVWWAGAQSQAGGDSRVSQPGFTAAVESLEKTLDAVEQQQYLVIEALARAPRGELSEDDDGSSEGSSDHEGGDSSDRVQPDVEMVEEGAPGMGALASGSVISRLMRALEGQQPARAAPGPRKPPGAGGGLAVGGDGADGVGTALSAFLEHLITKNSGATRNIQPVGLSEPSVLVTTYYALVRLLTPYLEAARGRGSAQGSLATFPAADSFLQGLEGSRKDKLDRYGDMARLGGTAGHLVREVPPSGLDKSPVTVPLLAMERSSSSPSTPADVSLAPGSAELAGMLDAAMLLYYLGLAPVLKNAAYQASSQEASVAQLADVERRLAGAGAGAADYARHLREAQHVFRDDIVDNTCLTIWNKIWLNGRWKREVMFKVTIYVVRMLMEVGHRDALFRYVPEFYVEAVVDACHALRGSGAEGDSSEDTVLTGPGLSDIITFLTLYFNDPRIINPDVREALLQSISMLMQSARFVAAFAENPVAREKLMASLLAAFDQRSWVTISNTLVRITYGLGFGQSKTGKHMATASQQLSALLHQACLAQPEVLAGFLNRLFNTLNWTVTEFTVSLKDVHDAQRVTRRADQNIVRRCILMFELSVNLARILEVLATQLPETFLRGSSISLTRLVEVLSFILSHTTDGPGAAVLDAALSVDSSPLKAKVSRPLLLAPIVGMLTALHAWDSTHTDSSSSSSSSGGQQLSVLQELAASEMCPMRALDYAASLDWSSARPSLGAVDPARVAQFRAFVEEVKDRRAAETAAAADELEAEGEVPDDFLDPLLQTVMRDPVTLPDSHITIDRSTIERHLLGSKTDPFNRSPLTAEALQPNDELRARIQEWQRQRSASKAARTTA